ncbi:MAG: hypothetical protein M1831_001386 [Alyxoria varia]|nr:MAG: hypothetical protein M1831_001386 [Alyxoria varia]
MLLSFTRCALALASLSSLTSAYGGSQVFEKAAQALAKSKIQRGAAQVEAAPEVVKRQAGSRYLNEQTRKFVVDGTSIPEVPFDIGESYAGLMPISGDPEETRKLFFWFFPSTNPAASDEITYWFNGGPGCSSLSGLLTENGPFTWEPGTYAPTKNSYSWTNLTNMIWIEQPVGVGYTQGVPNITNEIELAQQFIGFHKQLAQAFQLEDYKVPYCADAMIKANDKRYYNLKGIAINDPIIGDGTLQQEVPVAPYVDYWSELFFLNKTFTDRMHDLADHCNYTSYYDTHLTFPPPKGKFPLLTEAESDETCDIFSLVLEAAQEVNPCFNIYHITDTCPSPYNILGIVNPGDYKPPGLQVYFNRSDVQSAINAPVGTNWSQCTSTNVFGGATNNQYLMDRSLGPAQDGVLQNVIESTNNTLVGVGNLDFLLPPNGTLLALQNTTWHGVQGLQKYPSHPFFSPYHPEYNLGSQAGAGILGTWGEERGLLYYQIQLAGHELPGYAAGAAYRVLERLLGRVKSLSITTDFTTQGGDFGN